MFLKKVRLLNEPSGAQGNVLTLCVTLIFSRSRSLVILYISSQWQTSTYLQIVHFAQASFYVCCLHGVFVRKQK